MNKIPSKIIQEQPVPAIGLGTWELEGRECRDSVTNAIHLGYRHIDTAREYGNEADIGAALVDTGIDRDELFLTSKVWWEDLDEETVINEVDASLEALQTDYIDLVLIHWPNPEVPLDEPLGTLEMLQEGGLIKYFGVSNFTPDILQDAMQIAPLFCNQVEYHPLLNQSELLDLAVRHDLLLTAYSPLAQGDVESYEALRRVADRHRKSPEQIALRWLVDQPKVVAIPRSSNPVHLRSNLEIFDFDFDDEDLGLIASLPDNVRKVDPAWGPVWTT